MFYLEVGGGLECWRKITFSRLAAPDDEIFSGICRVKLHSTPPLLLLFSLRITKLKYTSPPLALLTYYRTPFFYEVKFEVQLYKLQDSTIFQYIAIESR